MLIKCINMSGAKRYQAIYEPGAYVFSRERTVTLTPKLPTTEINEWFTNTPDDVVLHYDSSIIIIDPGTNLSQSPLWTEISVFYFLTVRAAIMFKLRFIQYYQKV